MYAYYTDGKSVPQHEPPDCCVNLSPLQLSSRKVLNVAIEHVVELELLFDTSLKVTLIFLVQELLNSSFDSLGNLVHVLWLDDGLELILQNLGEVVLGS